MNDLEFRHLTAQLDAHPPAWPQAIACLRRVDSTQRLARRYAATLAVDEEQPPPTAFVALEQTAGRGRQGNTWRSPAGRGLYATWLVVVADPAMLAGLPLRLGAALATALSEASGVEVRLKWPNDLWVSSAERQTSGKAGGILIETFPGLSGAVVAAIGVGVNLGDWTADGLAVAAFARPAWHQVFGAASAALLRALDTQAPGDLAQIAAALIHRPGDHLRFRAGGQEIDGEFVGLDETGRLLLRLPESGVRAFASGEVVQWSGQAS